MTQLELSQWLIKQFGNRLTSESYAQLFEHMFTEYRADPEFYDHQPMWVLHDAIEHRFG